MPSALSIAKLFANLAIALYDHDPGVNTALIVSPDGGATKRVADLSGYDEFGVVAMSSTLTGAGINKLEICACDASDGTGNITVIKDSGAVVADAVGDYVALECTAEEIAQLSPTARYVFARLTLANAADEAVVAYIRGKPRHAAAGLTATAIA